MKSARIRRGWGELLPDLEAAVGHHLLAAIDSVMPRLDEAPPPARPLAEELRLALARTAARGDTCQVRAAADGVRRAAALLQAGAIDNARAVLVDVRAALT